MLACQATYRSMRLRASSSTTRSTAQGALRPSAWVNTGSCNLASLVVCERCIMRERLLCSTRFGRAPPFSAFFLRRFEQTKLPPMLMSFPLASSIVECRPEVLARDNINAARKGTAQGSNPCPLISDRNRPQVLTISCISFANRSAISRTLKLSLTVDIAAADIRSNSS